MKLVENRAVGIVIGVNLLSDSGKSIYNSLLTIDSSGQLRSVRRKLMPTHGERLCWAQAENKESAAVASVEMSGGERVGGLMCWEHWMPRARDTMHKTGEDIHIAAWPHCSELHQLASRHYAFEGSCYVLTTALVMSRDDLPDLSIEIPDSFTGLHGGSAIIAPDTSYVVEPVLHKEELIIAEIDVEDSKRASFRLDTGGHYDRPDVI